MPQNSRRRFLAAGGAIAAALLAGCAGIGTQADDDMDRTPTPGGMTDDDMGTPTPGGMTDDMADGEGMDAMDPMDAPMTAIDRFSEAAGTLMVRTSENGLPGPDEPIDFDQAPFITRGLGPHGDHVAYYNFDVQPTTAAPIYAFFREGEDAPVEGQLNVIDVVPGDMGYNDFWHVHRVTVPESYEANTVTSLRDIRDADYDVEPTSVLKNCPVVPAGSTATERQGDGTADLVQGWYKDQVVHYFLFEEAPLSSSDGTVPVSPIYVTFNRNPDEPDGGPASGFMTEPDADRTHNVVATLPADDGYSPLGLVNIYDNADFDAVADLDTARDATILAGGAATVNCPIVSTGMAA